MRKILFISTRNPFLNRFSGDVIRAKKFIIHLSKKNLVDVISLNENNIKKKFTNIKYIGFKESNLLEKLYFIFTSLFKLQPMQNGYFYSKNLNDYVIKNKNKYDLILSQSFRTAQFVPNDFKKKKILDMGDLYSLNYKRTFQQLNITNPMKFIYFIESLLIRKYEKKCFKKFDKIFLFSKKEIDSVNRLFKKKIIKINFGIDQVTNKFKYSKKNYKIIFVGNIKYTPNRVACYEFVNKILPELNKNYPNIEFHIIGEISKLDNFFLSKKNNVKILGKQNKLDRYLINSICGMANLNISSGVQTKLLTYMSYGLPSVCSEQVANNFDKIKNFKLTYFKNNQDIIKLIIRFLKNKKISQQSSRRSLIAAKFFLWNKIFYKLDKILK